jgi:hypothetical protein
VTLGIVAGAENTFPEGVMGLLRTVGKAIFDNSRKIQYTFKPEYVPIEPFTVNSVPRYNIVIDRTSHWREIVLEWLKKVTLDGVYIINDPHNFHAKKKNYGYAAMTKLGFNIPKTYMLPTRENPEIPKEVLAKYNRMFDLAQIGQDVGYPCFMKPYDGGGWKDVTKIHSYAELIRTYNQSGTLLMNLQQGIEYDHFVRCLCIGPKVIPLKYMPENPMHERYVVAHNHLDEWLGHYIVRTAKIINAFHGFELNSAEFVIKDGIPYLIDFNNPVPDMGIFSLHHYYPMIMKEVVRYIILVALAQKRMHFDLQTWEYLAIADSEDTTEVKMQKYGFLADQYFETARLEAIATEIFDAEYENLERSFFYSDEFAGILEREIRAKFWDNQDKGKFHHFLDRYKRLVYSGI